MHNNVDCGRAYMLSYRMPDMQYPYQHINKHAVSSYLYHQIKLYVAVVHVDHVRHGLTILTMHYTAAYVTVPSARLLVYNR